MYTGEAMRAEAISSSRPVTFFHQPVLRVPPSQYASNE
jgi:hypothetical protein